VANSETSNNEKKQDLGFNIKATNIFVNFIESIRNKTTGPILGLARACVYGVILTVSATITVIFLLIGLIRLVNIALPGSVWSAYLALGVVFYIVGVLLWSRRTL
jgi:uncharacterized membrane protein YqjE|tara:strand:- start:1433 stop:1747 length:315 start_codon:yes stop_codon:yes gene_type:complete